MSPECVQTCQKSIALGCPEGEHDQAACEASCARQQANCADQAAAFEEYLDCVLATPMECGATTQAPSSPQCLAQGLAVLVCSLGGTASSSGSGGGGGSGSGGGGGNGGGGGSGGGSGGGGGGLCVPGVQAPCYSGPAGTEGVGICQSGVALCDATGTAFGPCTGDVLPQPEDCATPADEDCDGTINDGCLTAGLWSKRFGPDSAAEAVAVDTTGNVLLSGRFQGTVDLGGGPLTASLQDAFVTKLSPDGNHLWTRQGVSTGGAVPWAIATDALGNVVVTGGFTGTLDFGGGPVTSKGLGDVFLVKLGPTGDVLWTKSFGESNPFQSSDQHGWGVACDGAGNVLLSALLTNADADFGGGYIKGLGALVKFDPSGQHLWSKAFPTASGAGIAPDSNGNVWVTGRFGGQVDFGGGPLVAVGTQDAYVAKLGPGGEQLWAKGFGAAGFTQGTRIAIDAAGNALVLGHLGGAADFGGGLLTSAGDTDVFIVKLSPAGAHVWSKRFGDANGQMAYGLGIDAAGNPSFAGSFKGTVDFGGGPISGNSDLSNDLFVAKLSPAGEYLSAARYGDGMPDDLTCLAVDATSGARVVVGLFQGMLDLGSGPLVAAQYDGFVGKLGP
ncbi:hypothetical protein [Polyangium sp. y55x31]|uniref:hypothetical protein n=1 Tax=Polyangium sp. y55x31 TaxID=3042688 RepID=UPI002482EF1B|nr:hypothetical protein [Polyangium sp. y55x31]MDI1483576.1 hypothetical protein [Polyangium sp. y55x31]